MEALKQAFEAVIDGVERLIKAVKEFLEQLKPWVIVETNPFGRAIVLSRHWTRADAVISAPPRENVHFLKVGGWTDVV